MRPKHYKNPYRANLLRRIEALNAHVFTRSDLIGDHNSNAQLRLTRALNAFVEAGQIIKVARGVYAKGESIELRPGVKQTVLRKSFEEVVVEVLGRLGIKWRYGQAIQDYNAGKTQQIPVRFEVRLESRYRGHIAAEGRQVYFEKNINAK